MTASLKDLKGMLRGIEKKIRRVGARPGIYARKDKLQYEIYRLGQRLDQQAYDRKVKAAEAQQKRKEDDEQRWRDERAARYESYGKP